MINPFLNANITTNHDKFDYHKGGCFSIVKFLNFFTSLYFNCVHIISTDLICTLYNYKHFDTKNKSPLSSDKPKNKYHNEYKKLGQGQLTVPGTYFRLG